MNKGIKTVLFMVAIFIMATRTDSMAQTCSGTSHITEDQSSEIAELGTAYLQEMQSPRDQINAIMALYQSLMKGGSYINETNATLEKRGNILFLPANINFPIHVELITIGDELLSGDITDTNSSWMAQQLNLSGISVSRITSVGDSKEDIIKILHEAGERADIIITTGGLGPTIDDVTKPALCKYFDTDLVFREYIFRHIVSLLEKRGFNDVISEKNRKQAEIPAAATPLHNLVGTAPGLWFEKKETIYISLPGVPFEMKELMTSQVIPRLTRQFPFPSSYYRTVITLGSFEAHLTEILSDFEKQLPAGISLAYYPSQGIIKLIIRGKGDDKETLSIKVEEELNKLRDIIPQYIVGYDDDTLESIIGKLLSDKEENLAVAESFTGGGIASIITSVPESSKYFKGGIVAYSNKVLSDQLAINPFKINKYGVVSQQVVEEMANNVRNLFNSTYSIAISGIAEPSNGTVEKPVGTTWIAVSCNNLTVSKSFRFGDDNRERIIQRASMTALNMLRKLILEQVPNTYGKKE